MVQLMVLSLLVIVMWIKWTLVRYLCYNVTDLSPFVKSLPKIQ